MDQSITPEQSERIIRSMDLIAFGADVPGKRSNESLGDYLERWFIKMRVNSHEAAVRMNDDQEELRELNEMLGGLKLLAKKLMED